MSDHLPEWISTKPDLIAEIQQRPLLERMLRRITPPRTNETVSEEQWNQIVESLKQ